MIRRLTKHTLYEVWNEWSAESVIVDHKPTKKELYEILKLERWAIDLSRWLAVAQCTTHDEFIKRYLDVEKVRRIYTDDNSEEFLKIVKRSKEPLGGGKCKRCKKPIHPNLSCEDLGFKK